MPEQGDIVLIPVPFTNLSSRKQRPVIVVSNDAYHRTTTDMVVVAMSSKPTSTEYSFKLSSSDLVRGRLNRPGRVRVDKIYTLSQTIAVKTFGQVKASILDQIRTLLQDLVAKKA